jgi:hypothetical protein
MKSYTYKELLKSLGDIMRGSQEDLRHVLARLLYNTHYGARVIANAGASLSLKLGVHHGKVIYCTGTGAAFTITLPDADIKAVGFKTEVVIGEVNTSNWLVKASRGADVLKGMIFGRSATDSATDAARTWVPAATDDTITLNGTTTGGAVIGDKLTIECVAINRWEITGQITQSGVEATPFSDTVA